MKSFLRRRTIDKFKLVIASPKVMKLSFLLYFIFLTQFIILESKFSEGVGEKVEVLTNAWSKVNRFGDFTNFVSKTLIPSLKGDTEIQIIQRRLLLPASCYDSNSTIRYSCLPTLDSSPSTPTRNTSNFPCNSTCGYTPSYISINSLPGKWIEYNGKFLSINVNSSNIISVISSFLDENESNIVSFRFAVTSDPHVALLLLTAERFSTIYNTSSKISFIHFSDISLRFTLSLILTCISLLNLSRAILELNWLKSKLRSGFLILVYGIDLTGVLISGIRLSFLLNSTFTEISGMSLESFISIVGLTWISRALLTASITLIPIKIYIILFTLQSSASISRLFTSVMRSMKGLFKAIFVFGIISLGQAAGLFLLGESEGKEFSSFGLALALFFDIRLESAFFMSQEPLGLVWAHPENLLLFSIITATRLISFAYFFSTILVAISHATSFDKLSITDSSFNPICTSIEKLNKKIDGFRKDHLGRVSNGLSVTRKTRIGIWKRGNGLSNDIQFQIHKVAKSKSIDLIIFDSFDNIRLFLSHLFKLKPNLMFNSERDFRIVLEYDEEWVADHNAKVMLGWLKSLGFKAPVLLFQKERKIDNHLISIAKVYSYLKVTSDEVEALRFLCFSTVSMSSVEEMDFEETSMEESKSINL